MNVVSLSALTFDLQRHGDELLRETGAAPETKGGFIGPGNVDLEASHMHRRKLEHKLARHLTSLFAGVSVVGGYHPLGSEISPLPAMEEARAVGAIVAFPCFSNPAKPFRFIAGDPLEPGPFGIMQPAKRHPVVQPDLVLVPLIAIDGSGTRLGRGKGHYDRALIGLKKSGARLIGIGWSIQRLVDTIPMDEWDIPLEGFASPEGVEVFTR